ncbi:MAG: heme ABC exporter ATP-binding protein CcmA [Rhizobiaceae bacterium]|nr:heme ABC exporter ATP-binding protein CcmA [Rhizobiaceae bacterium]
MLLEAENLAVERGGEIVFDGVSFALRDGGSVVVTGANGVGKSTLLRAVAGLLPLAAGAIRFEGDAEFSEPGLACHYLGHQNAMKPALTVSENLGFWREFNGNPHLEITESLEMVGLGEIGHLPFGYLSTGQRRRAAIAKLLVSYRPVWILDEPTSGLDKASEMQFAALMRAHLDDGGMLLAATHHPLGVEDATELRMGR